MSARVPRTKSPHNVTPLVWLLVLAVLLSSGCVRRRLTVRSNPPGALVYIDDQEIGTTPVSTSFIYYGTRKVRLVRDGYETITVLERFRAPWYQIPPLDFVSENVWPRELRDERILEFQLVPKKVVPRQELLEQAENLRRGSREGYVAPLPALPPMTPSDGPELLPPPTRAQPSSEDVYNPNLTFPPPPPPPPR